MIVPVAGLLATADAWGETGGVTWTTDVVTEFTTYCPYSTTWAFKNTTYTVSTPTTITITNCPCTISYTKTPHTTASPTLVPPPVSHSSFVNSSAPVPPSTASTPVITTHLSGTTAITTPSTKTPVGPSTVPSASPTSAVTAAAHKLGAGVGALGLVAGVVAFAL